MARPTSKSASAEQGKEPEMEVDGEEQVGGSAAEGEEEKEDDVPEDEEEDDGEDIGEDEFEVETILLHRQSAGSFEYLVGWKGYGPEHNTWEPEINVDHAEALIQEYWKNRPKPDANKASAKKARNSRSGASGTPTATASQGRGGRAARGSGAAAAAASSSSAAGGKRGAGRARGSNAAAAANGKSGGRASQKRKAAEVVSDDEPGFNSSHVDSTEKYKDVSDWENLVEAIDTIERDSEGGLQVFMTMGGGEKVTLPTSVAYKRCPFKILKFYEAHLKWKMSE